jgi:hypothetical protein
MWSKLSEKSKKPYDDMATKDHSRYEKEVDQLRTKGYFINIDGVKSTDKKKRTKAKDQNQEIKIK